MASKAGVYGLISRMGVSGKEVGSGAEDDTCEEVQRNKNVNKIGVCRSGKGYKRASDASGKTRKRVRNTVWMSTYC